jgi:hypothetical protein
LDHQETEIIEVKKRSNFLISVISEQNLHCILVRQELYRSSDNQGEEDIMLYLIDAKEIVKKWSRRLK